MTYLELGEVSLHYIYLFIYFLNLMDITLPCISVHFIYLNFLN